MSAMIARHVPVPHAIAAASGAVAVGYVAVLGDWRLVSVAGIAVGVGGLVLRMNPAPTSLASPDAPPRWLGAVLPVAWVLMSLLPVLRLFGGAYRGVEAAARGSASMDNMLQIAAAVSVIGCMLLIFSFSRAPRLTLPPIVVLLLLYPLLAVSSVTWSRLPIFTAGRAVEFLGWASLLVLLTWATTGQLERGGARDLLHRITQTYTSIVLVLVLWMVATPNHGDGRLEWPGGHPNISGEVVGLAVLLLFAHPRRRLFAVVPVSSALFGILLLGVQLQIRSRGSAFAMVAGLLAIQGVRAMRNSRAAALLLGSALTACAAVAAFAWDRVIAFILRDQSPQRVLGANGRRALWNDILRDPLGNEIWGVGMGAARDMIPAGWAGDAHSAWIDILLSLGVIGLGLVVSFCAVLAVRAVRWRSPVALGLLVFAIIVGTNTTAFHEPGVALGALVLATAYLYVGDPERPRAVAAGPQMGRE